MVILVDRHLCSSDSDVCSLGCEKFQESRVFVDLELIVLTSNWKNQIHVGSGVSDMYLFIKCSITFYSISKELK
jgi:hypothetical protein